MTAHQAKRWRCLSGWRWKHGPTNVHAFANCCGRMEGRPTRYGGSEFEGFI